MLTVSERLEKLEEDIAGLRRELSVAGSLTITALQITLDQLVDERKLPAATRTEIFGRLRKEMSTFRIGAKHVARGAESSIPDYRTKEEVAAFKHREALLRKDETSLRRELLRLPSGKAESDQ